MPRGQITTDHGFIKRWVEQRGGHPATVKGTGDDGAGILRIDFPGFSGERSLREISWDEFFDKFDEEELAFLHQDRTSGGRTSRFCKLVRAAESSGRPSRHGERRNERRQQARRTEGVAEDLDGVLLLEQQHQAVREIFTRVASGKESPAAMKKLIIELADLLDGHAVIEEKHFYPLLHHDEGLEMIDHSIEEHQEVKQLLADIVKSEWNAKLLPKVHELRSMVEEHLSEEESAVFPMARAELSEDQLAGLAQEMTATLVEHQLQGDVRARVLKAARGRR
jgi:hemerythrin-like domain-containing protein